MYYNDEHNITYIPTRRSTYLQDNFETTKTDIEELHKDKSNIYTQFVTILGIFSAIIFASFCWLELLKNILGNICEASTTKLIVLDRNSTRLNSSHVSYSYAVL